MLTYSKGKTDNFSMSKIVWNIAIIYLKLMQRFLWCIVASSVVKFRHVDISTSIHGFLNGMLGWEIYAPKPVVFALKQKPKRRKLKKSGSWTLWRIMHSLLDQISLFNQKSNCLAHLQSILTQTVINLCQLIVFHFFFMPFKI